MELEVYTQDGSKTDRTVSLDSSVFDVEPNEHVVWLDVRRIQAANRQGTHKTKERNEVRGSTRKLYRQKGTGRARAGDAKSPIRKGGGRAHGPQPREYKLNLNKKTRRLARRVVLSDKARSDGLRIVEDFSMEAPQTSELTGLLGALDLKGRKVLLLTAENEKEVYFSSRGLSKVAVKEGRCASTLDLLDADVLVVQEGALEALTELLSTAEPAHA